MMVGTYSPEMREISSAGYTRRASSILLPKLPRIIYNVYSCLGFQLLCSPVSYQYNVSIYEVFSRQILSQAIISLTPANVKRADSKTVALSEFKYHLKTLF